jgi:hypothetical protein
LRAGRHQPSPVLAGEEGPPRSGGR